MDIMLKSPPDSVTEMVPVTIFTAGRYFQMQGLLEIVIVLA